MLDALTPYLEIKNVQGLIGPDGIPMFKIEPKEHGRLEMVVKDSTFLLAIRSFAPYPTVGRHFLESLIKINRGDRVYIQNDFELALLAIALLREAGFTCFLANIETRREGIPSVAIVQDKSLLLWNYDQQNMPIELIEIFGDRPATSLFLMNRAKISLQNVLFRMVLARMTGIPSTRINTILGLPVRTIGPVETDVELLGATGDLQEATRIWSDHRIFRVINHDATEILKNIQHEMSRLQISGNREWNGESAEESMFVRA